MRVPSPVRCVAPRSRPRSVAGKASGSRKARSAIYSAVHAPTPRIARSCATRSSIDPPGMNRLGFVLAACARAVIVARLAAGMPSRLKSAVARQWAVGKVRARRLSSLSSNGSPHRSTSAAPSRRAAVTVICCPNTARTASSKPSQQPGARNPGSASMRGARASSFERWAAIASMSAPTSN